MIENIIIEKLDASITKLTEVSANLSQMIAVHDSRLDNQDKMTDGLVEKIKTDFNIVHTRIDKAKNEVRVSYDKVFTELEKIYNENKEQHQKATTRLNHVEKWMFLVSGGGIVIGYFLSKVLPILF
jgi:hypothetical protein